MQDVLSRCRCCLEDSLHFCPPAPTENVHSPTSLPLKPLLPVLLAHLPELGGADPAGWPLLPSGSRFQAAALHFLTGCFLPTSGSEEGQAGSQGSQGWNTACRAAAGSLPGSCLPLPSTCPQALPGQAGASHLSRFPGKQKQEGSWQETRRTEQGRGAWRGLPGEHGVLT